MQQVEGSSPFSRFRSPALAGLRRAGADPDGHSHSGLSDVLGCGPEAGVVEARAPLHRADDRRQLDHRQAGRVTRERGVAGQRPKRTCPALLANEPPGGAGRKVAASRPREVVTGVLSRQAGGEGVVRAEHRPRRYVEAAGRA